MRQPTPASLILLALSLGEAVGAQCVTGWQPGFGPAGTDYEVHATTTYDPDGSAGPLPARLVVGGRFTIAGTTAATSIASLDGATGQWSPIGDGFNGPVFALATLPNGNLVAGGQFTASGNQQVLGIAQWNGNAWLPLGGGTSGNVLALGVLANGDLIAGGLFGDIGANIARWNGSTWSAVGAVGGAVLAVLPQVGATFVVGGLFPGGILRWTGSAWSGIGGGMNGGVAALARLPSGDLVAGGAFTTAGGVAAARVARWNGAAWAPMGAGCDDEVFALFVQTNGDLLAGGQFANAGGVLASCVARWDGSLWTAADTTLPTGVPSYVPDSARVNALGSAPGTSVVAGGSFASIGGVGANNVALRNETVWRAANPGTSAPVVVMQTLPNGDVVAGGSFRVIEGTAANGIARWDGTSWSPFGSGVGIDDVVRAIVSLPNGDLIIGGRITSAGGGSASNIARWTATGWQPLAGGTDSDVVTLTVLANGDVVAGGMFVTPAAGLARWDGVTWSAIGGGLAGTGGPARVAAVATMANGDLVVAGDFWAAGGVAAANVARWNGAAWSPMASGLLPLVRTMMPMPNGDLLVGGTLLRQQPLIVGLGRWDGSSWSQFAPTAGNLLNAVYVSGRSPSDDLIVGGKTFAATFGNLVARWNGTGWSALAGPTGNSLLLTDDYLALARTREGSLLVGGLFTQVGTLISAGLARLTTSCPAAVTSAGPGCSSSGGSNTLDVVSLPWTGATCRLRSTGVPTPSLVFAVLGFGPLTLPLTTLFPQAGSACVLSATPDFVAVGSSVGGTFDWSFALPNSPALAGTVLFHQHVPFEFDAQMQLVAVTATNALQLLVGTF